MAHVVLLAHNGFKFDFPILLAEIERRPEQLDTSCLARHRVHFADTLPVLRKARQEYMSKLMFCERNYRCRRTGIPS